MNDETSRTANAGMLRFARAYIRSMRLYYAFVTGIAGWIGVAFARYQDPDSADTPRAAVVLAILFASWGVNQIVNDYLGLKEDRINAPHRPMVTGELPPLPALVVSAFLMALACTVSFYFSPLSVLPLILGILLNIAYEFGKSMPFLGNVLFGIMMSACTAYGYLATTQERGFLLTSSRISILLLVALMNGLMTYYTYFKDYWGDKAAGVNTAVVFQGLETSRKVALLASPIPLIAFAVLKATGNIEAPLNGVFLFLGAVTIFLQGWTGYLFFRNPKGRKAYYSLVTGFRACTCGQVTLIALFNQELALYLYIASYVFIGFLFDLYKDPLS